ncbi:hypothetical protein D3C77_593330 [compost metagenome]
MSKHRCARLKRWLTLFNRFNDFFSRTYAFCNDNDTMSFAIVKVRSHPISNLVQIKRYFRHKNRLCPRSQSRMQSNIPGMTPHNFNDGRPLMG